MYHYYEVTYKWPLPFDLQMMVRIEDMHAPKFPLKCVSLVELYKSNKLKFKTASTIEFHLAFAAPKAHASDLQVSECVLGKLQFLKDCHCRSRKYTYR